MHIGSMVMQTPNASGHLLLINFKFIIMKTKIILVVAATGLLTFGIMHHASTGKCPLAQALGITHGK